MRFPCALVAVAALAFAGCDEHEDSPMVSTAATATSAATTSSPLGSSSAAAPSLDAKVQQIFATRCASCHGPKGKGDGPVASTLDPRPRDYSDVAWQKATTDDAIAAIVSRGGMAVHKSPMMPPSPDLASDPAALAAMVKLVRSFGNT